MSDVWWMKLPKGQYVQKVYIDWWSMVDDGWCMMEESTERTKITDGIERIRIHIRIHTLMDDGWLMMDDGW